MLHIKLHMQYVQCSANYNKKAILTMINNIEMYLVPIIENMKPKS